MWAYIICTVCVEYTDNAQDNTIIIMILLKPWPTHVKLHGRNTTDIQICLHHVCSIHEHSHGGLHTTSVYFHLISKDLVVDRPQSNCLCTGVLLLNKQSRPSTNGTSLFESNTLMLRASVKSTHFLIIRVQLVIT